MQGLLGGRLCPSGMHQHRMPWHGSFLRHREKTKTKKEKKRVLKTSTWERSIPPALSAEEQAKSNTLRAHTLSPFVWVTLSAPSLNSFSKTSKGSRQQQCRLKSTCHQHTDRKNTQGEAFKWICLCTCNEADRINSNILLVNVYSSITCWASQVSLGPKITSLEVSNY